MLSMRGKPLDIREACLGKITWTERPVLSRRSYIYVSQKLDKKVRFYAGVISSQEELSGQQWGKIPAIYGVHPERLKLLKDDDMVLLEPNGNVNVVWDRDSQHNSILATQDCNCRCIMCPQPRKKDPKGFLDFNLKLINLLDPSRTHRIGITGGEPTLLGDGLFRLISACKKRVPKASITLLTNGRSFKDLLLVKKLADLDHPDLCVCIPLYADNDKEHDRIMGTKGSFYETIEGLTNLALFTQKIEVRTVLHSMTYKRLPQFADFVYRNFPFVVHVAFMGLETTGLALKNLKTIWIDPVEYQAQLKCAVKSLHRRAMNVSVYNLQLCIIPKELWRFSRKSISSWKNIYIEQCKECDFVNECAGFFETSRDWHSRHIHPLKREDQVKRI